MATVILVTSVASTFGYSLLIAFKAMLKKKQSFRNDVLWYEHGASGVTTEEDQPVARVLFAKLHHSFVVQ